jgi:hypothetical protein
MSLQLQRNDQQTVINIAQRFVTFYYTQLNNKTYTAINPHLKDHTIYSSQKIRYKGREVLNYYNNLQTLNATFNDIDFDTLHAGARRINVLVTGTITYIENSVQLTKNFTEYIHFGSGNDGNMWIQMSIMKIL